jgi:hypothetical protein
MHFRIATILLAAGMALQGCASGYDGWRPTSGGGGKPGPLGGNQQLQPVTIVGINPVADPKPRYSIGICLQSPCNLTVTVDASCNISLDPQYMGLRYAKPSDDFTLVFTLQSPDGHQFLTPGPGPIDWKSAGGNTPVVTVNSPQQVSITFKNAHQARRFLYGIRVADSAGSQCGELDPGVIPDL